MYSTPHTREPATVSHHDRHRRGIRERFPRRGLWTPAGLDGLVKPTDRQRHTPMIEHTFDISNIPIG
jgi:hypothetical protein